MCSVRAGSKEDFITRSDSDGRVASGFGSLRLVDLFDVLTVEGKTQKLALQVK